MILLLFFSIIITSQGCVNYDAFRDNSDDPSADYYTSHLLPYVIIRPANGSTDVDTGTDIVLTFSEKMRTTESWSVDVNGTIYDSSSPEISWTGSVLTINPASDFLNGETISINLSGFRTVFGGVPVTSYESYDFKTWSILPVSDTGLTDHYTSTFGEDSDYVDTPIAMSFTGPTQHETYSSDYTTKDNVTGLIWKTCPEGQTGPDCSGNPSLYSWGWWGAHKQCFLLNLQNNGAGYAGRTDWRLPSVFELTTLFDYSTLHRFIDETYFPGTTMEFMTSSFHSFMHEIRSDYYFSYRVNFYSGQVLIDWWDGYVRCVSGP